MAILVQTKSGTGKVVGEICGKAMVEILNQDGSNTLKEGKPLRVLVKKSEAIIIGYIDGGQDFEEEFYGSNPAIDIERFEIPTQDDTTEYDNTEDD